MDTNNATALKPIKLTYRQSVDDLMKNGPILEVIMVPFRNDDKTPLPKISLTALIDTGASHSAISNTYDPKEWLQNGDILERSVDEQQVRRLLYMANIAIPNTTIFLEATTLFSRKLSDGDGNDYKRIDMLIGRDLLGTSEFLVNFATGEWSLVLPRYRVRNWPI